MSRKSDFHILDLERIEKIILRKNDLNSRLFYKTIRTFPELKLFYHLTDFTKRPYLAKVLSVILIEEALEIKTIQKTKDFTNSFLLPPVYQGTVKNKILNGKGRIILGNRKLPSVTYAHVSYQALVQLIYNLDKFLDLEEWIHNQDAELRSRSASSKKESYLQSFKAIGVRS